MVELEESSYKNIWMNFLFDSIIEKKVNYCSIYYLNYVFLENQITNDSKRKNWAFFIGTKKDVRMICIKNVFMRKQSRRNGCGKNQERSCVRARCRGDIGRMGHHRQRWKSCWCRCPPFRGSEPFEQSQAKGESQTPACVPVLPPSETLLCKILLQSLIPEDLFFTSINHATWCRLNGASFFVNWIMYSLISSRWEKNLIFGK